LLFIVSALGCGGKKDSVAKNDTASDSLQSVPKDDFPASVPDTTDFAPASAGWSAGIVRLPGSGFGQAVLMSVRHAVHARFDRLVFEFAPGARPIAQTEYIDSPVRHCASGEVVPLAGDAWLELKLTNAVAHTEEGHPTINERAQSLDMPIVKELKLTCDFEADVTWVAGVSSPEKYRLFVLDNPPRVVIDLRHSPSSLLDN
jgi:hypothetical protein